MKRRIQSVFDVAERQLCSGCGACAYVEPDSVQLVDVVEHGIRPVPKHGERSPTPLALAACPGIELAAEAPPAGALEQLLDGWGPVLEIWEGHASDPAVRWAASSGGAATALALHALDAHGYHGVLHITAREDIPYLNRTVLTTERQGLLSATGSRYAPASPCDSLELVEQAPAPCVFIGKPCDVAGARRAAAIRPALAERLGLTIAIFCAGTPSTAGTLEMIEAMGAPNLADVHGVRYRGNGWPGDATVTTEHDEVRMSYERSWGAILQRHRPWRCHICPDHTGEFADIAVGDPWYRDIAPDEPGSSLVLVRTERGRAIVDAARASGALVLTPATAETLLRSQPNLLHARGAVWGRTTTTRALGIPTPRYRGLPTFGVWRRELSPREKVQSVAGTLKRVWRRRLFRRARVAP